MRFVRFNTLVMALILSCFLAGIAPPVESHASEGIETPEEHFGFVPGTDGMLFDYGELIDYLQKLDAVSPRLKLLEVGTSPMGKTIYIAFISSEENINNLDELQRINRELALDPDIPEPERDSMIDNGRVFVMGTLSMHSGEVGPSQAAPQIAYDFVTTDDPEVVVWLDNVVYMMIPCHNPDGMDMIVNHYRKYKGTKYEGSSMPGVYHKYVGHDNNRDFVALTQVDTKVIARIYSKEWHPQVMVEKHQMGSTGPRYFVPPMHDPISENVDAGVWNWTCVFGSNMITDMTEQGLAGVSHNYLFDDYWPGSTETCIWKNVIGFLTESASVQYATPIYVEPNELRVIGKGLAEYKISINMPHPWPGGWWRLSDILEYEIASTVSIIKTASNHREAILRFRNDLCRREVTRGQSEPPYYYILPLDQHDKSELVDLANLLMEHGVHVYYISESVTIEGTIYSKGDLVVPLSQPFRPFIKEVMERQKYPVRHYTPGGEIIRPYDVTSWSLPLHRGVKSAEVDTRSKELESALKKLKDSFRLISMEPDEYRAAVFTANHNESYKAVFLALKLGLKVERLEKAATFGTYEVPKGSFVVYNGSKMKQLIKEMKVSPLFVEECSGIKVSTVKIPRIALVETYFHDMDAGWTRFLFDTYSIPYKVVRPSDFENIDFVKSFDIVVFPDAEKSVLMEGKRKRAEEYYIASYPPEYTNGIGDKVKDRLMVFIDKGGTIISWGRSARIFLGVLKIKSGKDEKEEFRLPVRDISEKLRKEGLSCPGCFMKVLLAEDHPLTLGMPSEIGVFFRGRPVFTTSIPVFDMDRAVIGKFPEKDILLSGYSENEEKIGNKTAMVWMRKGKGQLVLFTFNPQFRASTNVSYKLLFNSILLPGVDGRDN
ncbi:MAG: hypothetical protein JSV33_02430 [bacterium]|nr:MAG: hypothetical protein JSV33_02430 [bacterium]